MKKEKMNEEEKKQILKRISNYDLEKLFYSRDMQHFTELADNAENNGLLYIAENLNEKDRTMKLPGTSAYEGMVKMDYGFSEEDLPIDHPDVVANAYLKSECGCKLDAGYNVGFDIGRGIPLELLRQGHIFYVVGTGTECSADFERAICNEVLGMNLARNEGLNEKGHLENKELQEWYAMDIESKVKDIRNAVKDQLPKGFEERLHIIPLVQVYE